MRLVHYPDDCHVKNKESMIRMCNAYNIVYEPTNDRARLNRADYDILWLPMRWISPDELPSTVKILYGPHHFVFPQGALVGPRNEAWSKRCAYNVLSHWNEGVFREFAPETTIPLVAFPFGVNAAIEDAKAHPKTFDCLVYTKRRDPSHLAHVEKTLQKNGRSYRVFNYGSYHNSDYMNTLKQVKFAIWLGSHESQGFAFQECLASNVPILLWDVLSMMDEYGSYSEYRGRKNLFATTATQWSSACGERILHAYEFEAGLRNIYQYIERYTPRDFILSRVNDTVAMQRILDWASSC